MEAIPTNVGETAARLDANTGSPVREPATANTAVKLSLRRRGAFGFLALVVYIVVAAWLLESHRQDLHELSLELEELHGKDAALGKTQSALHHSLIRSRELAAAGGLSGSGADDVALDLELVHSGLLAVAQYAPEIAPDIDRIERLIRRLRGSPDPRLLDEVDALDDALDKRVARIDNALHAARGAVWERYHRSYDRMTLVGVMVNVIGVIVFGALVTMFFSRLAWDLGKLKERAVAIVTGYRGPPLELTRRDEVGELMEAVNRMQTELRERERKLEMAREQYYHREKMAAMGSLASAVAHEINNPIAAIAGVAQAMAAAQKTGRGADSKAVLEGPEMILEQAQRISAISRQIAELTRPPTEKPSVIDINALVRNTCRFAKYDRRLQKVTLDLALYKNIPAVVFVADHATQVLMNLLLNAADALSGLTDRKPTIRVATFIGNNEVVMTVTDNGCGMDADTLRRAFEEDFSTKIDGGGRGLGLFICRSLVERNNGRIELQSTPGEGTMATVRLPARPATLSSSNRC